MPIYEYRCAHCRHEFEILQKMIDDPLQECPTCHQPALQRLISAAAFQLKGSGWYKTDYANTTNSSNNSNNTQNEAATVESAPAAPVNNTVAKSTDTSGVGANAT